MVENDSKLSLLAESFYSSYIKNSSNAFFLYLGEGVGGAIFINGRMIRGMNSAAGEIGHTLLRICDGLVEVEKLLSIANLLENFEKRKNIEEGGTLKDRFVKLQKAWFSGDRTAKELLEEFLDNLAIVLRNVCYMLNPRLVVFAVLRTTFGKRLVLQFKNDWPGSMITVFFKASFLETTCSKTFLLLFLVAT